MPKIGGPAITKNEWIRYMESPNHDLPLRKNWLRFIVKATPPNNNKNPNFWKVKEEERNETVKESERECKICQGRKRNVERPQ